VPQPDLFHAQEPPPPPADTLADLTPAQREATLHVSGPMLVVAGPGSGKTRVITRRIAHLVTHGVRPDSILAITFTNKAAEEMSRRVLALCDAKGAWVRTFHSTCAAILRRWPQSAGLEQGFTIYDSSDQSKVVRQVIKALGFEAGTIKAGGALQAISGWKSDGVSSEDALKSAWNPERRSKALIYQGYERSLAESMAVDFDDLLTKTLKALETDANLRAHLQARFEHVLIDEYQDTSPVQFRIAKILAAPQRNLFVVGDPDQSIYAFRKADLRNILDFEENFPGAKVVRLEHNFRSVKNVLRCADALIAHNKSRRSKKLLSDAEDGPPVRVISAWTEREEGLAVADQILAAYGRGVPYRDIAVFYRVNAQSRALEAGLRSRGIPYVIVKGTEFYERAEIKDLLAYLKLLANPADKESAERVMSTPSRGVGKATIDRVRELAKEHGWNARTAIRRAADHLPARAASGLRATAEVLDTVERGATGTVAGLLSDVMRLTDFEKYLREAYEEEADDRWANAQELLGAATEYDLDNPGTGTLPDFLTRVGLVSDVDKYDPDAPRVALMTLHSAKGLEFSEVVIAGIEEGLLPHSRSAEDADALEEERRLLFVGITRAKKRLTLTYCTARTARIAGPTFMSGESRFLAELPQEAIETDRTAGPASVPTGLGGSWRTHEDPEHAPAYRTMSRPRPASDDFEADPAVDYAADDDPSAALRVGLAVHHEKFGRGSVRRLVGRGANAKAVVFFDRVGEKTLVLAYAKLTPMGE
jgi:DNA helicase-2/ATP-dependent DNA helicase PcrA